MEADNEVGGRAEEEGEDSCGHISSKGILQLETAKMQMYNMITMCKEYGMECDSCCGTTPPLRLLHHPLPRISMRAASFLRSKHAVHALDHTRLYSIILSAASDARPFTPRREGGG
jgi:hypothetical protein